MIKDNPVKEKIAELQNVEYGSGEYKQLKITFPCITPAGIFMNGRKKADMLQVSGYLFFDIDANAIETDVDDYKNQLLKNYSDIICVLGKSISGKGLFFYVKAKDVTKENYDLIYEYLRTSIFNELPIDNNAKGINRTHLVPYDKDVYYNDSITYVTPNDIIIDENRKETLSIKIDKERCYMPNVSFLSISQVLEIIDLEPQIELDGQPVLIEPLKFYKVFFAKEIKDGKKHSTFRALTQGLMYLNPDIDLITIQSFINYVNQNNTTKPMDRKEMMRTVEHTYNLVKQTDEIRLPLKVKRLHFDKSLDKSVKNRAAAKLNGLLKRLKSVNKINKAKEQLIIEGKKATQKAIAQLTSLSEKTVNRNINQTLEGIVEEINRCCDELKQYV